VSATRLVVGLLAAAIIAPAAAFAPASVAASSPGAPVRHACGFASRVTAIGYAAGATVIGDLSYTYDRAGRRTTAGGSLARVSLPAAVGSTTYNAANQLTKWATNQTKPTYDPNGNTLTDGTLTYVWNARDELVSLKTGNTVTATFAYDGLGRRISKTVSGTTTRFAFDLADFVQEQNASGTPTANLLTGGLDQTFGRTDAAGTRTLLSDALGSTVALADAAGVVGTSYTYEPYGKTSQTGSANANSQQFTGRENDGPLYYYRARYYQPTFGRFVSEDPAGFAAGDPNLYRYVGGSPTNLTDPSGEIAPFLVACAAGAAFDVGATLLDNWLGGRKTSLGDLLGHAALGCGSGLLGFGIGKALASLIRPIEEGIYVVTARSGLSYVGQSMHITTRLARHVATRKIGIAAARTAHRIAVPGGRTAREVAEQLKIRELGGVGELENVVNPIGHGSKGLLQSFADLDEYLSWLDFHL
jgi:RHS repeat-associated protein